MATTTKKPKNEHKVNNLELVEALRQYKILVAEAKEKGLPKPRVPEFIGECLIKIATGLSYYWKFIGYSWKQEMISDGIENCLRYLGNFDPERKNAHAYFTEVMYWAFVRRIKLENNITKLKKIMAEESSSFSVSVNQPSDSKVYDNPSARFFKKNYATDWNDEGKDILEKLVVESELVQPKPAKVKKPRKNTLEMFFESEDPIVVTNNAEASV